MAVIDEIYALIAASRRRGIRLTAEQDAQTDAIELLADISGAGGTQDVFKTIAVAGQSDIVADGVADILTLIAGTNITITTNAGADSITINAAGAGAAGYNHTQSVASTSWVVTHGLGYWPVCQAWNDSGELQVVSVTNNSLNQATITVNSAMTGKARFI